MKRGLALTLVLLAAEAAVAQPPPRDAPIVAGPTASGATLRVYDTRSGLCGTVRSRVGRGTACDGGGRLREPLLSLDPSARGPSIAWGFVAPEVLAVEIVYSGGRRVQVPTTDGPAYTGRHAGKVRFFLAEIDLRRGERPLYARLLGAGGGLLAAVDAGHDDVRVGPGHTIARGRVGPVRWRFEATLKRELTPLPGEEERLADWPCVSLRATEREAIGTELVTRGEACADPDAAAGWELGAERTCARLGLTLVGLAPPEARRLVAVKGDGRRVRVPLRPLPRRFGGRRAFVLALGARVAVRRLVAIDGTGRRVLVGGLGPGVVDCPATTSSFLLYPGLEPRFGDDPPALRAWDRGVLLCATIGLPAPDAADCQRPPVDEQNSRVFTRRTDAGTYAAGVVPAQVAAVVLELADGGTHRIETTVEGPYAGRYRGLVRFFSALLPQGTVVRAVRLLDAGGRRLIRWPLFEQVTFDRGPMPLLRGRHGWRLGGGIVRPRGRPFLCLQITRTRFERDPAACDTALPGTAGLRASCRPGGTVLFGRLRPGRRALSVETTRGVFRARIVTLAPLGIRGRAFLVVLPARARPLEIVVAGRRTRRTRLRVPAAANQCGYQDHVMMRS